ncbi:putative bifunctional diguanylate cyclase/phosphodiesterase [Paenibacillus sp. sgz302251]|uniref:putative bifunctional diguanylate cyclase/phosphodiesterase n=1 Tax=Paenibacillus sp. sgz302251 TaxID=3414493 RepID=UPI003C7AB6F5
MNPADSTDFLRLLPQMLDEIEDSIYVMKVENNNFKYYYVNQSATRMSGVTMAAVGQTFFERFSNQMANYLQEIYSAVLTERKTIRYEDGFVLPDGRISGENILTPIMNEKGEIEYVFCVTRDITERKEHENMLRYYAYHDDLTKLYNRRFLLENIVEPAAVFLFDLDNFKNINDTFGHNAGDAILIEVAERLREQFGFHHKLVRLGGDEFIVVSSEASCPERMVESVNELFRTPFVVNDRPLHLHVSVGVAVRVKDEDIQTLLKQADTALYQAKGEGRGRHHVYEAGSKYNHVENFIYELALSNAIEREELELRYQAVYSPATKKIIGAEALLRWNRSRVGLVSPADFIPVAEETGLIIPIGYWVIRKACQDWHKFKTTFSSEFKVSVNISKVQLNEEDFVENILRILEKEQVAPQAVVLEITESTFIHNIQAVQETLRNLREAGFTIALDDFGTGYSSLSMLTLLPIDHLKIDRSFIRDMNQDLIAAVLEMAKALKLRVIAEGVEDFDQFSILAEMNCWGLQGYFISKPVEQERVPVCIAES